MHTGGFNESDLIRPLLRSVRALSLLFALLQLKAKKLLLSLLDRVQ